MVNQVKKTRLGIFPLTTEFRGTTLLRAFFLNAICLALVSALSIQVRQYLDRLGRKAKGGWALSDFSKTAIVSLSGFSVAVTVYFVLWALFGYGGGMITARKLSPVY